MYRDVHGLTDGLSQLRKQFAALQSLDEESAAQGMVASESATAADNVQAGTSGQRIDEADAAGTKHADGEQGAPAAANSSTRRVQTVGGSGLGLQARTPRTQGPVKSKRHRAL